jgi:hypothetical protein
LPESAPIPHVRLLGGGEEKLSTVTELPTVRSVETLKSPQRRLRDTHLPALANLALLAIWLMHRFIFTTALPAGTDFLGFVARASDNAHLDYLPSAWSPTVLGAPRPVTLDNVLGLLAIGVGGPVAAVKLLSLLTLMAAGMFAYLLGASWFNSRLAGLVAGILYMTSQASLSRWGSGQLNIEIATAVTPLILYLFARGIDQFSTTRALALGLASAVLVVVRIDMVLYMMPILLLYAAAGLLSARSCRATAVNLGKTATVAIPTAIGQLALIIVPVAAGVRAGWFSAGPLFALRDLQNHSLGAYVSLLGFGREIGYFGYTGQQTWFSHPYFPVLVNEALATVPIVLALSAMFVRRDRRTLFLAAAGILGAFLAKGFRMPAGGPYLFLIQHVPILGNLRNPNRWLIMASLAFALLAGVTINYLCHFVRERRGWDRVSTARLAGGLILISLLPVSPTILRGFYTWKPTSAQVALMSTLGSNGPRYPVATVPYDQSARFVRQGGYSGWEHDLGTESSLFTGHPALTDGAWSQRTADFVGYTSTLLANGDPAFERLLGGVGVQRLIQFTYPVTAPHLVADDLDPLFQQRAVDHLSGLQPKAWNSAGTVFALSDSTPTITLRANRALVLGGPSGYAAMADLPGIDLSAWVAQDADDALEGGRHALIRAINDAQLVVMSDVDLTDLTTFAAPSLLHAPGITSDPGLDRLTQLVPADQSIYAGSLADSSVPPPQPLSKTSSSSFTASSAGAFEVWGRVRSMAAAGTLTYRVDGRLVGKVTPLAPANAGFRWIQIGEEDLAAGRHTLSVNASASKYGSSYEVDESRVISRNAWASTRSQLSSALAAAAGKTVSSFNLQDSLKWNKGAGFSHPGESLGSPSTFWKAVDRSSTTLKSGPSRARPASVSINAKAQRQYYALAEHDFNAPTDWTGRPYLFLAIEGQGAGAPIEIVLQTSSGDAFFTFKDDWKGWTDKVAALGYPDHVIGRPDLGAVLGLKVAVDSRAAVTGFRIGSPSIAGHRPSSVAMPFTTAPTNAAITYLRDFTQPVPAPRQARVRSGVLTVPVPADVTSDARIVIEPADGVGHLVTGDSVDFQQVNLTEYKVHVEASSDGLIVLAQSYDPGWQLTIGRQNVSPIPVYSTLSGFPIKAGSYHGTLAYSRQGAANLGLLISAGVFVLACLLMVALWLRARARSPRGMPLGRYWATAAVIVLILVAVLAGTRTWAHWQSRALTEPGPSPHVLSKGQGFWSSVDPHIESSDSGAGPDGRGTTAITLSGPRPFYAFVAHTFSEPQDWTQTQRFYVLFRGSGTGAGLTLNVTFANGASAVFPFIDVNSGWRVLSFIPNTPARYFGGQADWRHVTGIKIATDSRRSTGRFVIGTVSADQAAGS